MDRVKEAVEQKTFSDLSIGQTVSCLEIRGCVVTFVRSIFSFKFMDSNCALTI